MEFIRGLYNVKPQHRGCVLTIGNFDGVHRGHVKVLSKLKLKSAELNLPSAVLIFEPQPQEYFRGGQAPERLSTLRDKLEIFRQVGIDRVICLPFDDTMATMPANQFIETLLIKQLGVAFLVVGDDFHFGKDRSGNFTMLAQAGKQCGFDVVNTDSFLVDSDRVSSTLIRQHIRDGRFDLANSLLGYPYCIKGKVIHGEKIGRSLGFPTANIRINRVVSPLSGIFAVKVKIDGADNQYQGIANVGMRPTVSGNSCLLEVYIFDFTGNLYSKRLCVELVAKIRDEQAFASLDELKQQIAIDVQNVKSLFNCK